MSKNPAVEFSLFAPNNEEVSLVGDWENWKVTPMQRGDDGWWRVDVPLNDGTYQYKFRLKSLSYFSEGKTVEVTDPRADRVSWDQNENAVITVKNGQRVITTYEWKHDDVPLPPNEQLIMYELHIADFRGGPGDEGAKGNFQGLIDKLDYLRDLGINAVELMPVNEFPGERSWGYNPRVLFAVENSYGSTDDLCRLIDECHARGMRVILDGVYNHGEVGTPLAQIDYAYWYYRYNPDKPEVQWGPKFNYEYCDEKLNVWPARSYVRDAILHWIEHFHIDGIRFDATAIIDNYDVLYWLREQIFQHTKSIKPFFAIAEHVPPDPTVTGNDGPMDAAWHETFSKQMMSTVAGREQDGRHPLDMNTVATVLQPRHEGYDSAYNVVNYLDNHDQDRMMWQIGQAGFQDDPAFRRMKLGAAILLTAPGIPLLWMGQEFGESAPKMVNDRQPIDWALLKNERNSDLLRFYQGLTRFRHENPALYSDTVEIMHVDHNRSIIAYKRWNNEGNIVVVVANLRDQYAGGFEIGNWPGDGTWHEHVYNYDVQVDGGVLRDELAESGVKIYVKR